MAQDPQIRVIVGELNAFAERIVKRIALNTTANLIEDTPVDTSWARANWIPQIGSSADETAGTRQEAEQGQVNAGPQQEGTASVAVDYHLGPEIHITNNVPYIEKLNDGHSVQAPAGFVQEAILKAIDQTLSRPG